MQPKPPPPLAEILDYLQEIGYPELYLRSAGPAVPEDTAPVPADAPPAVGGDDSAERRCRLAELATEASTCLRCKLSSGRKSVVFGSGHPDADLMLVGEGPGAEEDRQGLPFVGPAGQLLTRILRAIDLERDQVYIANMVKCRPPGNRDPEPDELAACRGFLEQQVDLVRPKVIVALGRVAANALLATDGAALGDLRGRWYTFRGVRVRVTYHPAALLRQERFKRPTWEDMQVVRDELKRPN